jgi:hypothetical protein
MSDVNICGNVECDVMCFGRSVPGVCSSARLGRQAANVVCAVLYWHYVGETKENHEKIGQKTDGPHFRCSIIKDY